MSAIIRATRTVIELHPGGPTTAVIEASLADRIPGPPGPTGPVGPSSGEAARAARVYLSTDQAVSADTPEVVAVLPVTYDTDSMSGTSGRLTFTTAGLYLIDAQADFAAIPLEPFEPPWEVALRLNGTEEIGTNRRNVEEGEVARVPVSATWEFEAGDYVELVVVSAGDCNINGGETATWLSATRAADMGATGAPGPGFPAGGDTGTVLTKLSDDDYDTAWQDLADVANAVDSVNGQTGVVVLDAEDVGAETPTGAQAKADAKVADAINNGTTTIAPSQNAVYDALALKENTANKGVAGGYASLDGGGKVPIGQLPSSIMEYQGVWNANTNGPTLVDGTGSTGDVYRVGTAGTQNLGSGSVTYEVGDYIIYNGSTWEKSDTTDAVATVFSRTGNVTAQNGDYTATQITNTPAGNIAATTVQAAINELDTEKQAALGFTPENVANKDTDGTLAANSDTKYPSQKATKTYVDGKVNMPTCRAYRDSTVQSIPNGSWTNVQYNQESWDSHGMHDTVTNNTQFVPPVAGKYLVTVHNGFPFNVNGERGAAVRVNGNFYGVMMTGADPVNQHLVTASTVVQVNGTSDYIEGSAFQSSGAAQNIVRGASYSPEITVTWVAP